MTELLVATALRVRYGARPVLSGVSLQVGVGELVAVIGANGAGKTTLLKTLAGLLVPHSGSVRKRADLRIAYLAQSEAVPLDWSVRQVVELGRLPYVGFWRALTARDRAAVDSALICTATRSFESRMLRTLSGGERQRVMLARALAQEPSLLLLDEPTTHLDVRQQADLFRALRHEADHGVSSIAVLHDLTLAGHADRCILLQAGAVVADGTPESVLRADILSQAYQTALDVVRDADGRHAVVLRPSSP